MRKDQQNRDTEEHQITGFDETDLDLVAFTELDTLDEASLEATWLDGWDGVTEPSCTIHGLMLGRDI